MRRALIGHTGFVGSNLALSGGYSDFYNSSNFREMAGQRYDEIVCSGISAVKWLANKEPQQDRAAIAQLLEVLATVHAERFTLISTIDVYADPAARLDEAAELTVDGLHPYGTHRLEVERFVAERFTQHHIIRLPALFGPGLRKNALFDLLQGNDVHKINPAGVFQWYPVPRLASDLAIVRQQDLRAVNLFTTPIEMQAIIDRFFTGTAVGPRTEPAPRYDLRTCHAPLFGGRDGYIMDGDEVLSTIADYVDSVRTPFAKAS